MSEFFETAKRERELYAALEAAEAKTKAAGVELTTAIWAHWTHGSQRGAAEEKARDQLLEIIREEHAARSAWAEVYRARKALEASAEERAA